MRKQIGILTDFGSKDGYVASMKGVIASTCDDCTIIDLSHDMTPQDITGAALFLESCCGYFPEGFIFLVVVDPGVGTARRILCLQTEQKGQLFIAPDNGVLDLVVKQQGVKERKNFYFFDAGGAIGENIIGVIAGMAYGARVVPPNKPILAFADDRDDPVFVKISGRANWGLVRSGLHLGKALREESEKFGGEGGGHDIAAGARVLKSKKEEFLESIDRKIGEQLKRN